MNLLVTFVFATRAHFHLPAHLFTPFRAPPFSSHFTVLPIVNPFKTFPTSDIVLFIFLFETGFCDVLPACSPSFSILSIYPTVSFLLLLSPLFYHFLLSGTTLDHFLAPCTRLLKTRFALFSKRRSPRQLEQHSEGDDARGVVRWAWTARFRKCGSTGDSTMACHDTVCLVCLDHTCRYIQTVSLVSARTVASTSTISRGRGPQTQTFRVSVTRVSGTGTVVVISDAAARAVVRRTLAMEVKVLRKFAPEACPVLGAAPLVHDESV